jgi:hypothetical protein
MNKLAYLTSTALVGLLVAAPAAFAQDATGVGVGIAGGGSVSGSGNSANLNDNTAISRNNNTNTNGGSAAQRQSQRQQQAQQQGTIVDLSSDNSGNNSGNYRAKPNVASTSYAPGLVASDDTCMGSSSVGGQGMTFGFSVGTTWRDSDCVRRKDARFLAVVGERNAALALMCQKDSIAEAFGSIGKSCIQPEVVASAPAEEPKEITPPAPQPMPEPRG